MTQVIDEGIASRIGIDSLKHSEYPVLDIGERMGWTGYIDIIEPEEMSHSVMVGTDKYGRPFIALRVKINEVPTVVTVFKRYVDTNDNTYVNAKLSGIAVMDMTNWNCVAELLTSGRTSVRDREVVLY